MKSEQLMRKQLDSQFKAWGKIKHQPHPKKGWINLIRNALGISTRRLAKLVGVSQGQIVQFEKGELNQTLTIASLQKVADSMGCQLVYGLIPKTNLEDIITKRATEIAKKRVTRVSHSMKLEAQGVDAQTEQAQIKELANELRRGPSKKLWSDK